MKRLAIIAIAGLVSITGLTTAQASQRTSAFKMVICHRTKSTKTPYVRIVVRDRATLRGHLRHAADIIPAPAGGCPKVAMTPTQGGTAFNVTLTGAAEVPGPGDPDGSGTATIRMQLGEALVCFSLSVKQITLPAVASHIHQGVTGQAGPVVVTLKPPGADGTSSGCVVATRTLVKAILTTPSGYYVNVHTTDYPAGAIRGQMA